MTIFKVLLPQNREDFRIQTLRNESQERDLAQVRESQAYLSRLSNSLLNIGLILDKKQIKLIFFLSCYYCQTNSLCSSSQTLYCLSKKHSCSKKLLTNNVFSLRGVGQAKSLLADPPPKTKQQ